MDQFRFAILGAGHIAVKFRDAVRRVPGCEVCAVASKSAERAERFAKANGVSRSYGSYEELLDAEEPDAAYIAVTPNDHFRLTMLCVERGIPVLCEKAMFLNSFEARKAFGRAKEQNVFVMEALWSRYLPAIAKAKRWLAEGRIGKPLFLRSMIGFRAPEAGRYLDPALGGGAMYDITVYAYELACFLLEQEIQGMSVSAKWTEAGVDLSDHVSVEFDDTLADLMTTFGAKVDEECRITGEKGEIVIPRPHVASECLLYDSDLNEMEHFRDTVTENGFVYEIQDVMQCIRNKKLQSSVEPWSATLSCAEIFDEILKTRRPAAR
jgi:predicted dehydrogenase